MATEPSIDALLAAELSHHAGQALVRWVFDINGRIQRGDMMLGILTFEEVRKVPAALARAAECGIADAWLKLAWWLANPPVGDPDIAGAEETLRGAIKAGVPGARLELVQVRWFYRREDASELERLETHDLVRALAEEDGHDAEALYYLGLLTCQGFGTPRDPGKAFRLQQQAAALGNTDAMFELYAHLATGLGVAQDDQGALAANRRAAEAGHPRAMYNMGAFHATGRLVEKDMVKAAEWYQRASDAGNPLATATLAAMYAAGDGVPQDKSYAQELFELADYLGLDVAAMRKSVGL
jgi:uncharacterized protein